MKTAVALRNFNNGVDASAGTVDRLRTFDDYVGSPAQHTLPGWDNVTGLGTPERRLRAVRARRLGFDAKDGRVAFAPPSLLNSLHPTLGGRVDLLLDVNRTYTDVVTSVFSSTIAMKAWFATAALVLVVVQVSTATRMWGRLERIIPLPFPVVKQIHRWSGRLAFLCTLPVFFHCVFILGFQTPNTRVMLHSIAGTFVYGVFAAKILIIRVKGYPHWVLPVVGGSLAALLATLWLTSALWYFTNVRFGF